VFGTSPLIPTTIESDATVRIMLIGFVGDVHGRVLHMLAAVATWQEESGREFDLILQVGDMGAYPHARSMDDATRRYAQLDDAEHDFARVIAPDGQLAERLRDLRGRSRGPVHFINGNHDDVPWLRSLLGERSQWADVDTFQILRYVRNGAVLECDGVRIGFLGWEEDGSDQDPALTDTALTEMMSRASGSCDVLVTHDAPYGTATGRDGRVQGSDRISLLLSSLQPRYHVFGHYHHLNGPHRFGTTVSLGLSSLVASVRWRPDATGLQSGCVAVLDTDTQELAPVVEPWLAAFPTPFDFDSWYVSRRRR
jgi:Icc-related predicted phosphoesterase